MGGSWTQEALFIVHVGDSAGTTATIESYTLFPLPFLFMRSCSDYRDAHRVNPNGANHRQGKILSETQLGK